METLVCDICGGKLQTKTKGIFVCTNCGVEYTTERMKEKALETFSGASDNEPVSVDIRQKEPVSFEIPQTEPTSQNQQKTTLPAISQQEEDNKLLPVPDEYQKACNIIRNSNNISALGTALKVLNSYKDLNNAPDVIRFGEEKIRRLKAHQRNAYCEQIYQNAVNLMESQKNDIRALQSAADQFNTIPDWKDAKQRKAVCLENIEKIKQKKKKKKKLLVFIISIFAILLTGGLLIGFNVFEIRDNLVMAYDDFMMNVSDTFSNIFSSLPDDSYAYYYIDTDDEVYYEDEDDPSYTDETIAENDDEETITQNAFDPKSNQDTVAFLYDQDDGSVETTQESDSEFIYQDTETEDDLTYTNVRENEDTQYDRDNQNEKTVYYMNNDQINDTDHTQEDSQEDDQDPEILHSEEDKLYAAGDEDSVMTDESENESEAADDESEQIIENPKRRSGSSELSTEYTDDTDQTEDDSSDFVEDDSDFIEDDPSDFVEEEGYTDEYLHDEEVKDPEFEPYIRKVPANTDDSTEAEDTDGTSALKKAKSFSNTNGEDFIPVTIYDDKGEELITFSFGEGTNAIEILLNREGEPEKLKNTENGLRIPVSFEADIFTAATADVTIHNKKTMINPYCSRNADLCEEINHLVKRNAIASYGERWISLFRIVDRSMIIMGVLEENAENWGFSSQKVDQLDIFGYGYHATFYGWLHLPDGLESEGVTFYFHNK